MGWLKFGARRAAIAQEEPGFYETLKATIQHIEIISLDAEAPEPYPIVPLSVPDSKLPFIPKEEVAKRKSAAAGGLLIVVDDIVYDCTEFIKEHPGGVQIVESFAGAECSWQFWRFHGSSEMEEFGRPLRVGMTAGLLNRYKEPTRYVGLRRLGDVCD